MGEIERGFENPLKLPCLSPLYFISREMVSPLEKLRHSFVRESATVRWVIGKLIKYFWGAEFNVISDCSVLQKFFGL